MRAWMAAGAVPIALAAGVAAAQDLSFPPGQDDRFTWSSYDDFAAAHRLEGQTLTIFGPWRGEDQALAESVLAYFALATGAQVSYASSENYEQQIVIDTAAGTPPDIAILPQPGLIADLAARGHLAPLGAETEAWLREGYAGGDAWAALGSGAGPDGTRALYAFPYRVEIKSLVWYVPENFADAGYAVPQTIEEMRALSDRIVADGGTPWCIGLGSGGATGWPATDWVEDMVLRRAGPAVYDRWVRGEVPFGDPAIVAAIEDFGSFARTDAYVAGGAAAVATTDFRDSAAGLFTVPPRCYLHRQASFIPAFFPEGITPGVEADFFAFPPLAEGRFGRPVLGSGTLAAITRDGPAARAFIDWLKTPIAHELWMAQTGFLTPHKGANPAAYANEVLRRQARILTEATTFRFDGSDLMPGRIGAGAFWSGMIDYVGGREAGAVAADIDAAWGALR